MHLLFLTHRLPCPPDRGCKLRSAVLLHALARRHDVWCAGFLDAERAEERRREAVRSLAGLRTMCRDLACVPMNRAVRLMRAMGGLASGGTATERCFASRRLERAVLDWAGQVRFDAVLAFSSSMAPLALRVPAGRRVLCMDDLDSRKWEELAARARLPLRWAYSTEARRLAARERGWIAAFDATALVSEREAHLVTDRLLRSRVHVIPAGTPLDIDE